jgi:threonine synthase
MKFKSTRDALIRCTFEEAICSGYAPDGGLFVPEELPQIDEVMLKSWGKLTFPSLAMRVIRLFIATEEIPDLELEKICENSFVKGFDESESTIPIRKFGSGFIAELFHGVSSTIVIAIQKEFSFFYQLIEIFVYLPSR